MLRWWTMIYHIAGYVALCHRLWCNMHDTSINYTTPCWTLLPIVTCITLTIALHDAMLKNVANCHLCLTTVNTIAVVSDNIGQLRSASTFMSWVWAVMKFNCTFAMFNSRYLHLWLITQGMMTHHVNTSRVSLWPMFDNHAKTKWRLFIKTSCEICIANALALKYWSHYH